MWQMLILARIDQTIPMVLIQAKPSTTTPHPHETATSTIPLTPPLNLESPDMLELLLPFLEILEKKRFKPTASFGSPQESPGLHH